MGATEQSRPGVPGQEHPLPPGDHTGLGGVLSPRTGPQGPHQRPGQLPLHIPEDPSLPEQNLGCSSAPCHHPPGCPEPAAKPRILVSGRTPGEGRRLPQNQGRLKHRAAFPSAAELDVT